MGKNTDAQTPPLTTYIRTCLRDQASGFKKISLGDPDLQPRLKAIHALKYLIKPKARWKPMPYFFVNYTSNSDHHKFKNLEGNKNSNHPESCPLVISTVSGGCHFTPFFFLQIPTFMIIPVVVIKTQNWSSGRQPRSSRISELLVYFSIQEDGEPNPDEKRAAGWLMLKFRETPA